MASLVLSAAGAAIGSVFGPVGSAVGQFLGATAGGLIDRQLFGPRTPDGPRLKRLDVTSAAEGVPIPRVYGRVKVAGQIIWATRFEEQVKKRSAGGKGSAVGGSTRSYSYFANLAVALGEGPVARLGRIWADGELLDTENLTLRFYPGTETQTPDPLIIAKEGTAHVPGFRGTAYVVFERLALERFGNRVPQLAFEVVRPVGVLESMIRAVTLIPGATEFGYDTVARAEDKGLGRRKKENRRTTRATTDVEASLDELQALCPNLAEVAVVVAWFGTDVRAGQCQVRPGVESRSRRITGRDWRVSDATRATAHLISTVGESAAYGGTPDDGSVKALIASLKARGLKVCLYPFVMMDIPPGNTLPDPRGAATQPAFPWRGRITCDPAPDRPGSPDGTAAAATQVNALFGTAAPGHFSVSGGEIVYSGPAEWSLRRLILHYAKLAVAAGGVDSFIIGSEYAALTRVRSGPGSYPAVAALQSLAADVKALLGPGTQVGYAADWTEYGAHVRDAGAEVRFPLDPLWASSAIDFVGIDWYPPVTDTRDGTTHLDAAHDRYDLAFLNTRLAAGEAFDWYYASEEDRTAQLRTPITDGAYGKPWVFRQKDLAGWWGNLHYERVGGVENPTPTGWTPGLKPIRLTEIGCPAVDKGPNRPSAFPDRLSSEGALPPFSSGARDDLAQRRLLEATLSRFDPAFGATTSTNPLSPHDGRRMVDPSTITVWTWDARPYPLFPERTDVWADAANWETGHWLTGRLGGATLDGLVTTLAADAGLADKVAAAGLEGAIEGYTVDRPMGLRAALEPLAETFAFAAHADGAVMRFQPRGRGLAADLVEDDLVRIEGEPAATFTRAEATEWPDAVVIAYADAGRSFEPAVVRATRADSPGLRLTETDTAITATDAAMRRAAEIRLADLHAGRDAVRFALPPGALAAMPGDVVALTVRGRRRLVEITAVFEGTHRTVEARTIDPDAFRVPLGAPTRKAPPDAAPEGPPHAVVLDLPRLETDTTDILARLAVAADPWPGAFTLWRSADGASFEAVGTVEVPAVAGELTAALAAGPTARFDRAARLEVRLASGLLEARSERAVLDGANLAAVKSASGAWEVLRFAGAELIAPETYRLTTLLRGLAGTELAAAAGAASGAAFVLLDGHVGALAEGAEMIDRPFFYRLARAGRDHADADALAFTATATALALRPLSPVHATATREAGGVRIRFIRRTRTGGDAWGFGDVPLGETAERYAVEIRDGLTAKRRYEVAVPSLLYPSADELADFGAAQTALAVTLTQLSPEAGPGLSLETTLHVRNA